LIDKFEKVALCSVHRASPGFSLHLEYLYYLVVSRLWPCTFKFLRYKLSYMCCAFGILYAHKRFAVLWPTTRDSNSLTFSCDCCLLRLGMYLILSLQPCIGSLLKSSSRVDRRTKLDMLILSCGSVSVQVLLHQRHGQIFQTHDH
jgi:hypothetical protein